jgi:hypothetical protein
MSPAMIRVIHIAELTAVAIEWVDGPGLAQSGPPRWGTPGNFFAGGGVEIERLPRIPPHEPAAASSSNHASV